MDALSAFTGAGGLDIGLEAGGLTVTAQCEAAPVALSVLERHWPDVPRSTDIRTLTAKPGQFDVIAGGFPCQDVSDAGDRKGLAGDRSGLWWELHRVIAAVRPRAVLLENVEGLLRSNGGRDFAAVVDALVDLRYGVAWRVLDSQHFGVPQQRRRVFVVAIAGGRSGARAAGEVLANPPGGTGDPSPHGRSWQDDRPGDPGGTRAGRIGIDIAYALNAKSTSRLDASVETLIPTPDGGLRRLTPLECERLQGWPDDWTRWRADGREVSDTSRYRMIGNGVTAPVAEWVTRRLTTVLATMPRPDVTGRVRHHQHAATARTSRMAVGW